MSGFVHLHLHSEFSLLDGACRITDIPKAAKAAGHNAVALTDHGVMYGVVDFYRACKNEGVKPIIGCEVYVSPQSRFDRIYEKDRNYTHLILLVKNEIGYKNLIYLVSRGFTEGFYIKPRIDLELLSEHSEGLIALSACLAGYIPRCIINDEINEAREYALKMRDIFGEYNFYLEVQNHYSEFDDKVNRGICDISRKTGIPMVATNDVHYIKKSDADIQALLMCIQTNNVITNGRPVGFEGDEYYYKSTEEMTELFSEYEGAIENTEKIARMCNFDFDFSKLYLPKISFDKTMTSGEYLRMLAYKGFDEKVNSKDIEFNIHSSEKYKERIEYELDVITKMGYAEYYLIVWDFVNFSRSNKIPTGPGRGSGAGSLVAYLIDITEVDSLKYNLLFEAFLNPERISMPDFDIDFCYFRRDEVIKYVCDKYGKDYVSQIITFGTLAARAAIRDVGRAMGMPYADVDIVAKMIPQGPKITLKDSLEIPELKKIYESSEQVKKLIDTSIAVEGMPRHASTHAAGVVISDKPLYEYVPLALSGEAVVTQYDMNTIADLGLLKFDFLGLRYLTIISDTEKEIQKQQPDFSIEKVPLDDPETYSLLSGGKTLGLFQLESAGMRQMLVNFKPANIRDVMMAIALYRPGPAKFIPKLIENRFNPEKIGYNLKILSDILDETYGCIVYQEQVMQIFRAVAGYTYGRADIVRRAISKKKADVITKERQTFIEGAVKKGTTAEEAENLFEEMTGFANYGFKKSHAAAYGLISYRTAYLKAHYPAFYFAALISSVLGNTTKMAAYIADAAHLKIKLLPPDINESGVNFTVTNNNDIRFGLLALKNVGVSFVNNIIKEREIRPFTSLFDFISRMSGKEINKRQVEALIKSGAFDNLGVYRSRLLVVYEQMIDSLSEKSRRGMSGQIDMFSADVESGELRDETQYPDLPDFSLREKLMLEKEVSGMYFSGHLLNEYSNHISKLSHVPISDIIAMSEEEIGGVGDKQMVNICAVISDITVKTTRKNEQMAFLTVDDGSGDIEIIVFPSLLKQYASFFVKDKALYITGEVSVKEEEAPKLILRSLTPLNVNKAITETNEKRLYLRIPDMESGEYKKAQNLLEIFDGSCPVVYYDISTKKYIKQTGKGADVTKFVLKELIKILGEDNVIFK